MIHTDAVLQVMARQITDENQLVGQTIAGVLLDDEMILVFVSGQWVAIQESIGMMVMDEDDFDSPGMLAAAGLITDLEMEAEHAARVHDRVKMEKELVRIGLRKYPELKEEP